ncbi:uncharacterized protein LOC135701051 [Ochlerotatus camptorhynchus]|uniref:uncharacterized protein LOC135701051 n=1 Tax=Ochlerotatus camptorhynchus TaxID=644619 RepID=UPI0031E02D06
MTTRRILVAVVVVVIVTVFARKCSANFVAYDEDEMINDLDEAYAQDEDQKREDYHNAIDRLISHALNQTDGKATAEAVVKVNANETDRDEDLKCAANRSPQPIKASPTLTVKKCCPLGEAFLHESISKCRNPLRKTRLPIVSREVHLYDQSCYTFASYLRHNLTIDGHCIGKHLAFNDGALFTVIQNGSLMVSSPDQMVIYNDYCLEETGSSVLVAHVCDTIVFPDPFDWVDKLIIGTALVTLFLTALLYAFEATFQTIFGRLITIHAALLFTALLLESALTEFNEAFYSTIVYVLIGASYVLFAAANLYSLFSSLSNYQKMDNRNVVYVAFGCCLFWLFSVMFTMYYNDKVVALCTVFSGLVLSVLVNLIILRGILRRRHQLLTGMDSCYEISDSNEYSTYVHHRKELAILSTFATILQLLHWTLFVASRYNLLYALSWCGLTIFAVFVCFRYRSITLLSGSGGSNSISKVLRHRHEQPHNLPRPPPEEPAPWQNGYNQLHTPTAAHNNHHHHQLQQQQQQKDNQKHSLTPVAEEEDDDSDGVRVVVGGDHQ